MRKGKLMGKILGIALVWLMLGSMVGGLPSVVADAVDLDLSFSFSSVLAASGNEGDSPAQSPLGTTYFAIDDPGGGEQEPMTYTHTQTHATMEPCVLQVSLQDVGVNPEPEPPSWADDIANVYVDGALIGTYDSLNNRLPYPGPGPVQTFTSDVLPEGTHIITVEVVYSWVAGSMFAKDITVGPAPSWTFTPPYNDCVTSTWNTPSPPQGDNRVLSQGFSTAVATGDANVGTFKYKCSAFGGTRRGINVFAKKVPPPNQEARAEAALVVQFVPPFTGDLRVEANLTIDGKTGAAAGSGLAAAINAVEEVGGSLLDWLTGKHLSALLKMLKNISAMTAAKARTDAFLQVLGGATVAVDTEITPSPGVVFPWGYYRQDYEHNEQAIQLSTVVNVTQGQPISISVGTRSHVESWGWAFSYANFGVYDTECQVNSIVLSKQ